MERDPETLMRSRRDSRGERDVKSWLRTLSDDQRFDFISRCLAFRGYGNEKRALDLATACISSPDHALAILRLGLAEPDASSIKFWLSFAIGKLGGARVVREIAALLDSAPTTVDKALYWLPSLLPPSQQKAREEWEHLHAVARRSGILSDAKTSTTTSGRVLFSDVHPAGERFKK